MGRQFARRVKYMRFARKAYKEGVVGFRVDRVAKDFTMDYFEGGGKESPGRDEDADRYGGQRRGGSETDELQPV